MPFTPSHAVVALPFVRTPLVPATIAVGAMTPDLPLFLRGMVPHYGMTHDPVWMPLTVTIALVLLLAWRCVLRPAVTEFVPGVVASRLPSEWEGGARAGARETFAGGVRGLLLLVLSLAIGVLSHIVWDVFTHEGRAGTDLFPVLEEQWGPLLGIKWLQHGSSAVGLVILAVAGAVWLARRRPRAVSRVLPSAARVVWWASLPAALIVASVVGLVTLGPFDGEFTPAHLAYATLPQACAVWGVASLLACIVLQERRRRTLPRKDAESGLRHARDRA
ncbi:DUF4184 family protein [Microbacterium sp. LMI1-1-1.1]|uniref:DUF4184 family protein n=1 Tax=Microbacterium sp. LMI1-1-1.1 TaxID=3135223 RepID=UPI0034654983